eukprot:TRINITY_DN33650_c0_g1_i1.p1 TRINITY_DN33650_c0_g1~~TRINITY_DN33650_c0_g1_i1.p1  ORF type:complete len:737 (+),score=144.49 TRINITY_DN33650_c0_g1_i1:108-2318(+)
MDTEAPRQATIGASGKEVGTDHLSGPADVLTHLPIQLLEHFKWLCFRAAVVGAHVARDQQHEAVSWALVCVAHSLIVDRAVCDGLTASTRLLLQRIAWAALPSLFSSDALEEYQGIRRQLLEASDLCKDLRGHLVDMAQAAAEHICETRLRGKQRDNCHGWTHLSRFVWASWRCYWKRRPWRGVNLGGWLLLEPGPSYLLWEQVTKAGEEENEDGEEEEGGEKEEEEDEKENDEEDAKFGSEEQDEAGEAKEEEKQNHPEEEMVEVPEDPIDEHSMCLRLGDRRTEVLQNYRRQWLGDEDFEWLRVRGFNAVRVPFGYWIVSGPTHGDSFVGPALEHLDHVVDLAEKFDFQVVLDLHGNPGGESAEVPCGRHDSSWTQGRWRRDEALEVLGTVAKRYADRRCVAGVQVANEPSTSCNIDSLCDWYEQAIQVIRDAGMAADQVAVVLPVYWYDRLADFLRVWVPRGNFVAYENVALDLHFFHCFGEGWESLDHQGHTRTAKRHGEILQSLPGVMVGEWSLARPPHVLATDAMEREFATAQLHAYAFASHGWFFWTYSDQMDHWDLGTCCDNGWLTDVATSDVNDFPPRASPPGKFPHCYGAGEFSGLPEKPPDRLDAQALEDFVARAISLAEATGRSRSEAESMLRRDRDPDTAFVHLLENAVVDQIVEATRCSREEASKSLRACAGDSALAVCQILDAAACKVGDVDNRFEATSSNQNGGKRKRDESAEGDGGGKH